MPTSLGVLIALVVAASAVLFGRALRQERAQVRNRGVNQASGVTWARAGAHAALLLLKFGGMAYLLATFYAFYMFERVCAREDWTRAAYERGTFVEHIADALRWPLYLEDDPPCGAGLPPADSAESRRGPAERTAPPFISAQRAITPPPPR